jgi:hypothetical protein
MSEQLIQSYRMSGVSELAEAIDMLESLSIMYDAPIWCEPRETLIGMARKRGWLTLDLYKTDRKGSGGRRLRYHVHGAGNTRNDLPLSSLKALLFPSND